MSAGADLNDLMRRAIDASRQARRLARLGRNEVALTSADHFEQGAATAYRNQNREQLEHNLRAALALAEQLASATPKA